MPKRQLVFTITITEKQATFLAKQHEEKKILIESPVYKKL